MSEPKRLLFVSSNPHWTARLDLDDEMRGLMHSLRGQDVEIMPLPAAQREDLEIAVTSSRVDVLHFSGHATDKEGLILRDEVGMEDAVSPARLAELIEGKDIKLAFLNACSTSATANAIKDKVDAVIGTNRELDDDAAKRMTKVFYTELGNGLSIDAAFNYARQAIEDDGFHDVYMQTGKAPDQPLLGKASPDGAAVRVKGQPHYDKYFFVSYLDEQIRDLKGRVALNRVLFWILLLFGLAMLALIWTNRVDFSEMDLLVLLLGEERLDQAFNQPLFDSLTAIGSGLPALLAFFQNRLTISSNQELQALKQMKELAKSSEELTPEMQSRLQKILDQCIRGADRDYQPAIDWYGFFKRLRLVD